VATSALKKSAAVVIIVLALAAVAFSIASCGNKTTSSTTDKTSRTAEQKAIDGYINELDRTVNSVNPGTDFDENQISDSALGL
jgi:flagellar basal body-associated protein FliL